MIAQKLNEDFVQRLQFAQTMKAFFADKEEPVIMMSDEAHFHLCGSVNKQNCRYLTVENPRKMHQCTPEVTVWCAVSRLGVIGPYFLKMPLEKRQLLPLSITFSC